MNAYQQKWLEILTNANLPGWKIAAEQDDIFIEMPHVTDLKLIRDNLPQTLAALSLDIALPKHKVKFVFHNGFENFDYILNPGGDDLVEE